MTDSITDALNYYFNFKDQKNNSNGNRRRRRDTQSNLKGEDFIDYGCWCNRVRYLKESGNDMNALDGNYKGGKVVDEVSTCILFYFIICFVEIFSTWSAFSPVFSDFHDHFSACPSSFYAPDPHQPPHSLKHAE